MGKNCNQTGKFFKFINTPANKKKTIFRGGAKAVAISTDEDRAETKIPIIMAVNDSRIIINKNMKNRCGKEFKPTIQYIIIPKTRGEIMVKGISTINFDK